MGPFEVKAALERMTVLVDTREQSTPRFHKRMDAIGVPYIRRKLDFGYYSAACTLEDGTELDLSGSVAIERKMDLDELCGCFCRSRDRFEREFIRAKNADAKLYLLIENGTWENAYAGKYRSRMQPKALVASLTAWLARYNCQIIFCEPATTGKLIREVLYRELKERLEVMECPQAITDS